MLFQVKILVPNSTAGMIIGKGGNYIKQVKEESGSYVQISQKAKDQSLQERCITVIGKYTGYLSPTNGNYQFEGIGFTNFSVAKY